MGDYLIYVKQNKQTTVWNTLARCLAHSQNSRMILEPLRGLVRIQWNHHYKIPKTISGIWQTLKIRSLLFSRDSQIAMLLFSKKLWWIHSIRLEGYIWNQCLFRVLSLFLDFASWSFCISLCVKEAEDLVLPAPQGPPEAAAKMWNFKPGRFSSSNVQFALKEHFLFKRWSLGNFLFNSCFYSANIYWASIMPAILQWKAQIKALIELIPVGISNEKAYTCS